MAASEPVDGTIAGSAPTQPQPAHRFVLEHPCGTSEILGTYTGSGRVAGKIAVVTGGSQSIGKTIVEMLALEGASVYFCSLCEDEGNAVAEAINKQLGLERAFHVRVDVSDREALAAWITSVGEKEGRVDILVPNAAAFVFGTIDEVDDDDWDKVLSVNVKGYANCVKLTVPWMRRAGAGSIVMTASVSSHIAQPAFVPYNTSKGAILQMSRCLAMDLGPENIRVNAVCPGTIDTPATAKHATKLGVSKAELVDQTVGAHFLKRLGSTKDCAQATLFLASDESSFITGTHLMVDGGYTAH